MSSTAGAAPPTAVLGLGLDVGGPWHHRAAVQRSTALVQTFLLTGSLPPPPTAAGPRLNKAPLRLPALVSTAKGQQRGGSSMARLSLSEPSLLAPNEIVLFDGFTSSRHSSVLQKRPPPPPPSFSKSCKTCHPPGPSQSYQQKYQQVQSCSRPTYIHFSQAIQPSSKPRPVRRHSHNAAMSSEMLQSDLRLSAGHHPNPSPQGEPLSVIGRPCVLSCSQRPAAGPAGPARTQLHVFLPSEAEAEEADSESVDEGFMDELDSKMTSLKLQRGKTVTYHS